MRPSIMIHPKSYYKNIVIAKYKPTRRKAQYITKHVNNVYRQKKSTDTKKEKKICVKAVFDSVNALVVYNTVQYGINQDNQFRNTYCCSHFFII